MAPEHLWTSLSCSHSPFSKALGLGTSAAHSSSSFSFLFVLRPGSRAPAAGPPGQGLPSRRQPRVPLRGGGTVPDGRALPQQQPAPLLHGGEYLRRAGAGRGDTVSWRCHLPAGWKSRWLIYGGLAVSAMSPPVLLGAFVVPDKARCTSLCTRMHAHLPFSFD